MKKSKTKAEINLPFFAVLVIAVFAVVFFVVLYPLVMVKYSNVRLVVTGLLVITAVVAAVVGIVFYLAIKKKV